ncbi:MAG: hypothetical protein WEE89_18795 [Gemmatimonadota bacterium]
MAPPIQHNLRDPERVAAWFWRHDRAYDIGGEPVPSESHWRGHHTDAWDGLQPKWWHEQSFEQLSRSRKERDAPQVQVANGQRVVSKPDQSGVSELARSVSLTTDCPQAAALFVIDPDLAILALQDVHHATSVHHDPADMRESKIGIVHATNAQFLLCHELWGFRYISFALLSLARPTSHEEQHRHESAAPRRSLHGYSMCTVLIACSYSTTTSGHAGSLTPSLSFRVRWNRHVGKRITLAPLNSQRITNAFTLGLRP